MPTKECTFRISQKMISATNKLRAQRKGLYDVEESVYNTK